MHSPVSVVIPCYRCADTIGRAVESVMRQTLPPAEILLVEDCSDDEGKTLARLRELESRSATDVSIRVVPLQKNVGPGEARNAGWELAGQPYLAFLDADDSWHPAKLEIQYLWMESHREVDLTGHLSTRYTAGDIPMYSEESIHVSDIQPRRLLSSNCLPTRTVMLRRGVVKERFAEGRRYTEDYLLWLTLVLGGHRAALIEAPLAYTYKADYGAGGLTGHMWKMETGELYAYRCMYRKGHVSPLLYAGLAGWSLLRYARRVLLHQLGIHGSGSAEAGQS